MPSRGSGAAAALVRAQATVPTRDSETRSCPATVGHREDRAPWRTARRTPRWCGRLAPPHSSIPFNGRYEGTRRLIYRLRESASLGKGAATELTRRDMGFAPTRRLRLAVGGRRLAASRGRGAGASGQLRRSPVLRDRPVGGNPWFPMASSSSQRRRPCAAEGPSEKRLCSPRPLHQEVRSPYWRWR